MMFMYICPIIGYKPRKARDPLLRHNSEDDEMTFSGLHGKADIPSKAFHRLKKMSLTDPSDVALPSEQGEQSGTFNIIFGSRLDKF